MMRSPKTANGLLKSRAMTLPALAGRATNAADGSGSGAIVIETRACAPHAAMLSKARRLSIPFAVALRRNCGQRVAALPQVLPNRD